MSRTKLYERSLTFYADSNLISLLNEELGRRPYGTYLSDVIRDVLTETLVASAAERQESA